VPPSAASDRTAKLTRRRELLDDAFNQVDGQRLHDVGIKACLATSGVMLRRAVPRDCHQAQLAFPPDTAFVAALRPAIHPSGHPYIQKDEVGLDALGRLKYLLWISEKRSFMPHANEQAGECLGGVLLIVHNEHAA